VVYLFFMPPHLHASGQQHTQARIVITVSWDFITPLGDERNKRTDTFLVSGTSYPLRRGQGSGFPHIDVTSQWHLIDCFGRAYLATAQRHKAMHEAQRCEPLGSGTKTLLI
jgi:hypothetical protein